jgi:hypothetical protein
MASIIKLKRSLTPGSVPSSLAAGELAINIPDKKLFSSNGSSVFNVSGDQYNLASGVSSQGHAQVTLSVDNDALSNDSIELIGGTGVSVTRNANGTITFASTGTVSQADTLSTARTINLGGDLSGSASFDGSSDITINATVAADSVALGTDTTGNYAASVANTDNNIVVTGAAGEGTAFTVGLAGTISSDTTGNAATATALATARNIQISGDQAGTASFDGTGNINIAVTTQNNSVDLGTHTTGNYVATVAAGPGIDVSGSGSETAGVTVGLAATIAANTTGNAATATQLATARQIALTGDVTGSANFDGSGNISISSTIAADSVALGTDTTGNYVATVTGTANEITVSGSGSETAGVTIGLPDNVTVGNNLTVSGNTSIAGNLTLDGNLDVNGTLTYIDSTTVTIGDNMLKLANTNSSDSIDMGFYSLYNSSGNKYTGLVRDATDGAYYLFDGLTTEPGQTINFGSVNVATLNVNIDGGTY